MKNLTTSHSRSATSYCDFKQHIRSQILLKTYRYFCLFLFNTNRSVEIKSAVSYTGVGVSSQELPEKKHDPAAEKERFLRRVDNLLDGKKRDKQLAYNILHDHAEKVKTILMFLNHEK